MKKLIVVLVAAALISAPTLLASAPALGQEEKPQVTCEYVAELLKEAGKEFRKRDAEFNETEPYSAERDVKAAQIFALFDLRDEVVEWASKNCKTS